MSSGSFGSTRISLPGDRSSGFTLIEVMVVLVLIGIVIGVATLSVRSTGEREAEREARRLAALMELASDEAVLKAQELGILFRQDGYQFLVLVKEPDKPDEWKPVVKDDVLRARTLPPGFVLSLYLEGISVDLDRPSEEEKPHGFFLSSGERSAFEVELGPETGVHYRVAVPVLGDLVVERPKGESM